MKSKPPAHAAAPDLPPVVLVHGIFRDSRVMRRLRAAFTKAGRRVLAPDLSPCDGSAGLVELAAQFSAYLEKHLALGERCDVIGHSLGGLVARAHVQRLGSRARVRRLVTLASPHNGSMLAWLLPGRGAHDLRPGSPFMRDLARDVRRLEGIHIASFWTPYDLIIVPPRSSILPVGRNVRCQLPHHRAFITDRKFARELIALLGAP